MKVGGRPSYGSSMGPRSRTNGRWWAVLGLAAALFSCRSARLGSGQAATPAVVAASPAAPAFGPADVDRALGAEWRKRGIVASPGVDDERFLRRVTLDIVGRIPTLGEIERFESDRSGGRRANVVRSLLGSPAYADH